jgi:hypothetical protein
MAIPAYLSVMERGKWQLALTFAATNKEWHGFFEAFTIGDL